jgi:uncharacterized protein (DUF427 family)
MVDCHRPYRNPISTGFGEKGESMKAIWNGIVIAESDDTVVIDGNHLIAKRNNTNRN